MRKKFLFYALGLGIILAYALIIGCPLYKLTGLRCPFCGMTRAHLAFLFCDLERALAYHKLFYLGIPMLISVFALDYTKKKQGLFIANVIVTVILFSIIVGNYLIN